MTDCRRNRTRRRRARARLERWKASRYERTWWFTQWSPDMLRIVKQGKVTVNVRRLAPDTLCPGPAEDGTWHHITIIYDGAAEKGAR